MCFMYAFTSYTYAILCEKIFACMDTRQIRFGSRILHLKYEIPPSIAKNCIYIHMPYNIAILHKLILIPLWRLEHFINTKNDEWLTNKMCIEQLRKKWLRTSGWETSTSMIGITFYLHANHTFLQLTILANTLSLLQ